MSGALLLLFISMLVNRKTNKTPRADLDYNGNMLRAGF